MSPYVAAAVVGLLHHALTAVPMLAFVMGVVVGFSVGTGVGESVVGAGVIVGAAVIVGEEVGAGVVVGLGLGAYSIETSSIAMSLV